MLLDEEATKLGLVISYLAAIAVFTFVAMSDHISPTIGIFSLLTLLALPFVFQAIAITWARKKERKRLSSSDCSLKPQSSESASKTPWESSPRLSDHLISTSNPTNLDTTPQRKLDFGCEIYRLSGTLLVFKDELWLVRSDGVTKLTLDKTVWGRPLLEALREQ